MSQQLTTIKLDKTSLEDLANGCAFLGSGGGGDTYYTLLELASLVDKMPGTSELTLLQPEDLSDDDVVAPCGWLGAPTISLEKLPSGTEAVTGLKKLQDILGKNVTAVMPVEIGGSNGLAALVLALRCNLPVVDCDGMGRAFPESQMVIFNVAGLSACPAVMTDAAGNTLVIETRDNDAEERVARAAAVALGGSCHLIEYVQSGAQIKASAIQGTLSIASQLGRSMREATLRGSSPVDALIDVINNSSLYPRGGVLFEGKISDVKRQTLDGFSVGNLCVESFDGEQTMDIIFQNENLLASIGDKVCAMVPDIISVVDCETGQTISTEQVKYGQRVAVIGVSAPLVLTTSEALAILGPSAFNMDYDYRPVEVLNNWECQ